MTDGEKKKTFLRHPCGRKEISGVIFRCSFLKQNVYMHVEEDSGQIFPVRPLCDRKEEIWGKSHNGAGGDGMGRGRNCVFL